VGLDRAAYPYQFEHYEFEKINRGLRKRFEYNLSCRFDGMGDYPSRLGLPEGEPPS